MSASQLLNRLRRLNVELSAEGGDLRCRAPAGTLTPALRLELVTHKAELLALLGQVAPANGHSGPSLVRAQRTGDLPLSFAQQRLWFLQQWEPNSSTYNVSSVRRLREQLDVESMRRALEEMVQRHESLRTTFPAVDGQPVQRVAPPAPVDLAVTDLTHLPVPQRRAETQRRVAIEKRRPFDLATGPLFRAVLLRQGEEHLLLLVAHHIVTDGWSQGILIRELMTLYEAFRAGRPTPLLELPLQYADFAVWQRSWLQGDVLQKQLDYWKARLAGVQALELPTDRPRPPVQQFRGAHLSIALPAELADGLRELGRREGTTLFMTLLAAFQTLLGRYSGQHDVVVGSPIAGRQRKELEGIIGFFVNTLVLRADLSGAPTFREFLGRVREACLGAYAHQDIPFEKLVEELQPQRDPSRNPLFQVTFTLQNAPQQQQRAGGQNSQRPQGAGDGEETVGISKFDLTLIVSDNGKGLSATFSYNTDLFEAATIQRLAGNFHTLLAAIVARPNERLPELPLLGEAERQQVLQEWNNTTADYPRQRCVHHLFEEQAARAPDAVAVTFAGQQHGYGEINTRADALARRLRRLGAGPGTVVGVCLERSVEAVVAVLAVHKAGAAYLPLDPAAPKERVAFMLADAGVRLLLTQSHAQASLPAGLDSVLCLDTFAPSEADEGQPAATVSPADLAYIIYTSGTTGTPRGVLVEHRGLTNLISCQVKTYAVGPGSRVLQFAALSFDASVAEIMRGLTSGACLCLASADAVLPGPDLIRLLQQQRVTHVTLPPSVLAALPEADLPDLKTLIVGGEACSADLVAQWAPGRRFFNAYGPTEATVCASVSACAPGGGKPAIGKPIANTRIYLLDARLRPVPVGVAGELHIGGVGLARGYLNQAGLTAEKFIPDPFGTEAGARLYKTGDRARWLADGNLDFLGRTDHQVKIRGFRIEPGEVEAALRQHPGVHECVAALHEGNTGDKRLVAYVVARSPATVAVDELRALLLKRLPDYMVPAAFVLLEALPLTANGKVDRKALPAPDFKSTQQAFVPPRDPVQQVLARVWAGVLRLERVGIHDNFFELGGDSILSIQIVARSIQAGLQVTPKDLFQHQTIAELAAVVQAGQAILANQGAVSGAVHLLPSQQWFLEQDLPEPHHFNRVTLRETRLPVDVTALEQAVRHVLAHHDALRLCFVRDESGWRQEIANLKAANLSVVRVHLSATPEADVEQAVEARAAELQAGFNLAAPPLLRVAWFDLGARPHQLLFIVHRLVADVVSWRIVMEDLMTAYQQLRRGKVVQLPLKTTSFKEWAERLADRARSEEVQQEWDDWLEARRTEVGRLPVDHPGGGNTRDSAETVLVELAADETQTLLQEAPQTYQAQVADVLLTALTQAMQRWTGQRSLLVTQEGQGREEIIAGVNLSRTVGWLAYQYPVRLDLDEAASPHGAVKAVKEQLARIPHRGAGYGLLRYLSGADELVQQLRGLPAPEVFFHYLQNAGASQEGAPAQRHGRQAQERPEAPDQDVRPMWERVGPALSRQGLRSHVLEIGAGVVGGRLRVRWTFSRNLHERTTVEALANGFIEALRTLISDRQPPEARALTTADFPAARLSQTDLETVLARLNEGNRAE